MILLAAAVASCLALADARPAFGATPVAGLHRIAIDSQPNFSNLGRTAKRHRFVILQAWESGRIRALKKANPKVRVLVYKNLSASIASHNRGYRSTGVSYQEAASGHPEWFLRNSSGERFTFRSYPYLWAMDVGSASYQRRWADNVLAELRREGWDGVFIDDANTTMRYHYEPSAIARYPTDAAWQTATRAALAYIGPRVKSAGKLAIANIGSWGEYPKVGRAWLDHLSGAMDEMFVKWGGRKGGYAHEKRWLDQVRSLEAAQMKRRFFLAVSHSAANDRQAARYGWASVLLGAAGRASFALHSDYSRELWFAEYGYKLGDPAGPRRRAKNGLYFRRFRRGIVVVNSTGRPRAMRLPGKAAYSGSGRKAVRRITLNPKRAAILLRAR